MHNIRISVGMIWLLIFSWTGNSDAATIELIPLELQQTAYAYINVADQRIQTDVSYDTPTAYAYVEDRGATLGGGWSEARVTHTSSVTGSGQDRSANIDIEAYTMFNVSNEVYADCYANSFGAYQLSFSGGSGLTEVFFDWDYDLSGSPLFDGKWSGANASIALLDSNSNEIFSTTGYETHEYPGGPPANPFHQEISLFLDINEEYTLVVDLERMRAIDDAMSSSWSRLSITTSNPVPEPSTMLLFGIGLAGLAAVGRKRRIV